MNYVLEVKNVRKSFKDYSSEFKRISSWFGLNTKPVHEHQILKGVNFSISKGESIGIIGQNGAGKSTLLKIITGTLKPTSGQINCNGRISAILELGMGFHPDLTGRQNVYHSGGLMGFTKRQLDNVIDEIEDFSEIGEYFDQPVRTYSSGMQVRVAFSIATAFRPEILIIDEALSVGDNYFQHKSFMRIREYQSLGTTLLIVSHDRMAIQSICDRAILLDEGAIVADSTPEDIFNIYNLNLANKKDQNDASNNRRISGTGEAAIESVYIKNKNNEVIEVVNVGEEVILDINISTVEFLPELVVGYEIKDKYGISVFGTNSHHLNLVQKSIDKSSLLNYKFYFSANIGSGNYSITIALHSSHDHLDKNYEWRDYAVNFQVINFNKPSFCGLNWLPPELIVTRK
jgi:lipopolysaccharide transport system ATP-binding protein